jgi:replicative DNA helicase
MCAYLVARGVNCLFLSKEMPTEQVCDRFESLIFGLSYSRFRSGALSPKEMRLWSLKRHRLTNLPLIISGDETLEGVGFSYIISKIQQYKPEVVFVDGAYLLSPEKVLTRAPLVERLACISRQFKAIAKATKTVIIEVVQMNRLAESEEGIAKGSLITLYGSDTWGQDADWVMDISGVRGANTRRISLLKARESNIGSFMIKFILDPFPDFSELRRVSIEPEEIITFEGSG